MERVRDVAIIIMALAVTALCVIIAVMGLSLYPSVSKSLDNLEEASGAMVVASENMAEASESISDAAQSIAAVAEGITAVAEPLTAAVEGFTSLLAGGLSSLSGVVRLRQIGPDA